MILINSIDAGQVKFELDNLVQNEKNFIKFYYDDNLEQIQESIFQFSIFDSENSINKNIIIDNLEFLANSKLTEDENNFINSLNNLQTTVYVICYSNKIHKKTLELFEKNYNLKPLNKYTIKKFIIDFLNKNNLYLQQDLINLLSERLPLDGSCVVSELNKLLVFKKEEINFNLIENIISEDVNSSIFKLVDNYLNNNVSELIYQINFLENSKVDFFSILNILVSQLYTFKLYLQHYSVNKSTELLEKDFGVLKFQIENWLNLLPKYSSDYIDILLKNLLELEQDIFLGRKDINKSLKLFLIKGVDYEDNI